MVRKRGGGKHIIRGAHTHNLCDQLLEKLETREAVWGRIWERRWGWYIINWPNRLSILNWPPTLNQPSIFKHENLWSIKVAKISSLEVFIRQIFPFWKVKYYMLTPNWGQHVIIYLSEGIFCQWCFCKIGTFDCLASICGVLCPNCQTMWLIRGI